MNIESIIRNRRNDEGLGKKVKKICGEKTRESEKKMRRALINARGKNNCPLVRRYLSTC